MELSPRERVLLSLGLGVILPVMFLRFLLLPLIDYKESLSSRIVERRKEMAQIRKKGEELLYFLSKSGGQKAPFNQQLERILAQGGVKKKANTSTRPGGGIALQLDGVTLAQATSLIYRLEANRPPIEIQSLEMKESLKKTNRLQIQLTLEGY